MNDYIPTTAVVRDAFSSESSDSTYANRMFDLWLAQYKAKIVAKTEERIIKLLCRCALDDGQAKHYRCPATTLAHYELIELIKGESKHTHEIEVFGAPCLGGDYHEYCLKCGWVEPCEIDGENK